MCVSFSHRGHLLNRTSEYGFRMKEYRAGRPPIRFRATSVPQSRFGGGYHPIVSDNDSTCRSTHFPNGSAPGPRGLVAPYPPILS
ncbi:unnamed protein product [Gemmata massiliana]|uniref:Uncharacterized protein n=1 Tax=Gemmata massiliana TaxID=1210884 RepID=A0A6P2D763_9BACT|nr:unnamed protein product [Gemmata massiliana]